MGALLVTLLLIPRPVLSGPELTTDPSARFRVHFTLEGQDAPPHGSVDQDGNGVPDDVDAVGSGVTRIYDQWVTNGGMRAPLADGGAGGDGRIDVYLRKLNGARGNTYVEDVGKAPAASAWIEVEPRSALVSPERLAAAAGHEAHHAIQYAYHIGLPRWIYEATATYVENVGFAGMQGETDAHFAALLSHPEVPLDTVDGTHEYDEMVFIDWARLGGLGDLARLWESMAAEGDDIDGIAKVMNRAMPLVYFDFAQWLRGVCDPSVTHAGLPCATGARGRLLASGATPSTTTVDLPPLGIAWVALPAPLDSCGILLSADLAGADGVAWAPGGAADFIAASGTGASTWEATGPSVLTLARGRGSTKQVDLSLSSRPQPCPCPESSCRGGCGCELGARQGSAPALPVSAVLVVVAAFAATSRRRSRAARPCDPAPPSPA